MQRLFSHQTNPYTWWHCSQTWSTTWPVSGSNKPPLQNGSQPLDSSTSRVQTSLDNSGPPSADPVPSIGNLLPQSKGFVPTWSATSTAVIKRIPKSSRHACTSHLASLLRKVVANPGSSSGWLDLFNWSQAVLRAPKRGGKRHNLSSTIKHRISSFAAGRVSEWVEFNAPPDTILVAGQSDQHVSSLLWSWQVCRLHSLPIPFLPTLPPFPYLLQPSNYTAGDLEVLPNL